MDGIYQHARQELKREKAEWEKYIKESQEEHHQTAAMAASALSACRRAKVKDYREWLTSYVDGISGHSPFTHYYDYGFPCDDWYVALRDFELPALFGAQSVSVIIPKGVKVSHDKLGHNSLYFCGPPATKSLHAIVPFYVDLDENNHHRP